jgi:hypothetical protein
MRSLVRSGRSNTEPWMSSQINFPADYVAVPVNEECKIVKRSARQLNLDD